MKVVFKKYHIKQGLFISILFPVIFFLLDFETENIIGHFIFSLVITFSFWVINSALFNFKKNNSLLQIFFRVLISGILTIFLYVSFGGLLNYWGVLISEQRGNWATSLKEWYYLCIKIILLNSIIILIKYLVDTNEEKNKIAFENEVLKRENLNATHETLKQQVNPHFLFNSLTTLRSLTKRNPQQAIAFIDELSQVYRYMLIHQNKNMVTLADELAFLNSYLFLLKIRFGDAVYAEVNVPDDELKYAMPPNTLQLLIENAVKHNIASIRKPLLISVFLKENFLIIQNNLQPKNNQTASSGLGLNNISHRYKLMMKKDIKVEQTPDSFTVFLPLK